MKKLLAISAAIVMMIVMMTVIVSAAQSGECGDNLTWTLTDDGTLTISGTGKMTDWSYDPTTSTASPWYHYQSPVKKVTIAKGVTSIGGFAFYGCSGLTSITIPDSVTSIGTGAFSCCSGLTSITIGNGVTSIEEQTFCFCESLTDITIGNSVTSIGDEAFCDCGSLTSVTIPNSVMSIADSAFLWAHELTDIYYQGTEDEWYEIEGIDYIDPYIVHFLEDDDDDDVIIHFVEASHSIFVNINGTPVVFPDQNPILVNDRTLVPLRAIFEALGATVSWDDPTQTVTSTRGGVTISLAIGSNTLYKNGEAITLDVPAQLINDRTMVPVRAISEAFGCTVGWDDATQTVSITA